MLVQKHFLYILDQVQSLTRIELHGFPSQKRSEYVTEFVNDMCSPGVVSYCHKKFFAYSEKCTTYSQHRHQTMDQVDKNNGKFKKVGAIAYERW